MLELTPTLRQRARGLTADGKQKISLGRGLVRSDVNVIMFDEPLTVIDPHLKWVLRSKLEEELHGRTRRTMIYVTHDQTEALTFAERVVVMNNGEVVQTGTPIELFERPQHTFVGHFIGSPRMNVLPCEVDARRCRRRWRSASPPRTAAARRRPSGKLEVGVRPGIRVVRRHRHPGRGREGRRHRPPSHRRDQERRRYHQAAGRGGARHPGRRRPCRLRSGDDPGLPERLDGAMNKTVNQKAWWFVLPVFLMVAFNAVIPLMTVVNYSVQESFGNNVFFWSGTRWFEDLLRNPDFHAALVATDASSPASCC